MSIVVAVKKNDEIVLVSDTQNNFGTLVLTSDNHLVSKVRKVGDAYIASTGWGLYDNIMEDVLSKHEKEVSLDSKNSIFNFFQNLWRDLHDNYSFVNDQCQEDDSPFGDLDASFLIINKSGIFNVASDTSVAQFKKYYAIGAGCDFSLGAIHALYDTGLNAEQIGRKAVEAATALNMHCGGRLEVNKISGNL